MGILTLVMGPWDPELMLTLRVLPEVEEVDVLGLKAVMLWDIPSARMNCSRSSTFVRPLARLFGKLQKSRKFGGNSGVVGWRFFFFSDGWGLCRK
jgi:hypothetical protein